MACRSLMKHTVSFFASTTFAILGSVLLLIGSSIWTVIVKKVESINDFTVHSASNSNPIPLGIFVSVGPALYLVWAAVACLLISVVPYMIRCAACMLHGCRE